jgi:hypothetical protein
VEIDGDLKNVLAVLVAMSPAAGVSPYVNSSGPSPLERASQSSHSCSSFRADSLHPRLSVLQYLDFSNYASRPWEKLLESLRDLAETQGEFTLHCLPGRTGGFASRCARPPQHESCRAAGGDPELSPDESPAAVHLLDALRHTSEDVKFGPAFILVMLRETHHDVRALPVLLEALHGGHKDLKLADSASVTSALEALGEAALSELRDALLDPDERVRLRAIRLIARHPNEPDAIRLAELLKVGARWSASALSRR